MAHSMDRSNLLECCRRLAGLHKSGDQGLHLLTRLLLHQAATHRDKLVKADPQEVPRLQGRALEIDQLLNWILTTNIEEK